MKKATKFARLECLDCNNEFFIVLLNDIPKYNLSCPICKSSNLKTTWIDRTRLKGIDYEEEK